MNVPVHGVLDELNDNKTLRLGDNDGEVGRERSGNVRGERRQARR